MTSLLTMLDEYDTQRVLLQGPPKSGKTALIGTLAEEFKLLFLDLEDGKEVLKTTVPREWMGNIEYVKIPDNYENTIACLTLLSMFSSKAPGYICKQHGAWNCAKCKAHATDPDYVTPIDMARMTAADGWIIVIDSATQFSISALNRLCLNSNITRESGKADEKISFHLWDGQGAYQDKLFGMIQSGPWNVVVTSHEMEVELSEKVKKLCPTIGTRNYARQVGKYFGSIIRLVTRNKKHYAECTTMDSNWANTGTRRNISLNNPGTTFCDYFRPISQIEDKIQKVKIEFARTPLAKPKTKGAAKPTSTTAATPNSSGEKASSALDMLKTFGK